MIMSYKIRIYPNKTQINKCLNMFGGCRFVYNQYINYNIRRYENNEKFISWREYRKIIKDMRNSDYTWLKELNKHSLDFSVKNANEAFKRFFAGISGFPKFKSRKSPVQSFYLDSCDKMVIFYNKHVKIPYLGKIRITESHYVPRDRHIMGLTVKKELDKYYLIFRIPMDNSELDNSKYSNNYKGYGYGIDVGIKSFLTISDSHYETFQFKSFLNDKKILKLEYKIKYLQQVISNKMEINYNKLLSEYLKNHTIEDLTEKYKNIMKGASYSNVCKSLQKKISKLKKRITNIKNDIINKIVIKMVKNKPEFITVETLSIKDMLENDGSTMLHKHIQDSKFYYFFEKLKSKCQIYNVQLRFADKYFASSKKCCICGHKKKNLKLSDRTYHCSECGHIVDRDVNASINLVDLNKYTVFND